MVDSADGAERQRQLVREFYGAFLTFDPSRYEHLVVEDAYYKVGHNEYRGRESFATIAAISRFLYPNGLDMEFDDLIVEGNKAAARVTTRAVTNTGADYENFYAVHLTFTDDGRVAEVSRVHGHRLRPQQVLVRRRGGRLAGRRPAVEASGGEPVGLAGRWGWRGSGVERVASTSRHRPAGAAVGWRVAAPAVRDPVSGRSGLAPVTLGSGPSGEESRPRRGCGGRRVRARGTHAAASRRRGPPPRRRPAANRGDRAVRGGHSSAAWAPARHEVRIPSASLCSSAGPR